MTKKEEILLGYGYHYVKYAHHFKLSIGINGLDYHHTIDENVVYYAPIEEIAYLAKQGYYALISFYLIKLEKEKLK